MAEKRTLPASDDERRDAGRYYRLLLALDRAAEELKTLEREGMPAIELWLGQMLPHLAEALDAEQAFAAKLGRNGEGQEWLELVALHPLSELVGQRLACTGKLRQLVSKGGYQIADPLGETAPAVIPELEPLGATSAVVVLLQAAGRSYVVGVCNKRDPNDAFLAMDGKALSHIVELVGVGAHFGEQRRRELQNIQATAAAISAELDLDELLPLIAERAAAVFGASATSLMLWDKSRAYLTIAAGVNLSERYRQEQRIPAAQVWQALESLGEPRALVTPDLWTRPYGRHDLVVEEGLRSALTAPLLDESGQPVGILNVYSKGEVRSFDPPEQELAQILAHQAAIAIRNAQLRRRELESLFATSEALRTALEPTKLYDLVTEKLRDAFHASATSLMLWDAAGENLIIRASTGLSDEYVRQQRIPKARIVEAFTSEGDLGPRGVPDLRQGFWGRQELYVNEGLRSVLAAPLLVRQKPIGLLNIYSKREPHEFTPHEFELAGVFANQVAAALDNADAYLRLKETGDYLSGLINSSLDGVIAIDHRGWIKIYSAGAAAMLGYSPEEVRDGKMRVDELYGDLEEAREINRQLHHEGKIEYRETRVRSRDGTWVPVILSAVLLKDPQGHPTGSVGYFKDLRPLRKAETELKLVLETVQTIADADDLEEGLAALAESVVTALGITFCHILLKDEKDDQTLKVGAAYAIPRPNGPELVWEPHKGRRISLADDHAMQFLLELPGPRVFRPSETVARRDVLGHIAQQVGLQGELGSALVLPLRTNRGTLGVCTLGEMRSWERSPFDDDRIRLADSLASQAAIHIDRMWAREAAERRVTQLETLHAVGEQTTRAITRDIRTVLEGIAQGACRVSRAQCAVIYPYYQDPGIYDVRHVASHGLKDPEKPFSPKLRRESKGMVNDALQERRLVVDDVDSGQDRTGRIRFWPAESKFLEREQVKSFVGIGMWVGDEPVGALFVNYRQPFRATNEDLNTIELFANQAATAIYQARLIEQGEKNRQALAYIQQITRLIGPLEGVEPIWQAVLDGTLDLTGAHWGCVLLWDQIGGKLAPFVNAGDDRPARGRCGQFGGTSCALLRQVLQARKGRLVLDTAELSPEDSCRQLCGQEVASLLAVPILPGGEQDPLGVILLESPERVAFSANDQELVENLANYGGLAAQSVARYLEIEGHARLREGLLEAGQAITALRGSSEVLQSIADNARKALGCDVVTLYTYDERNEEIGYPPLHSGALKRPRGLMKLGRVDPRSVVGKILKHGEPYYADDSPHDPWFEPAEFVHREHVRSSAGIPLLIGKERVGIFFVNYRQPHPFTPQEKTAVRLFATQAAIAIQNARLYEGLQKRTNHLNALVDAAKVVTAGVERRPILERILHQAVDPLTGAAGPKADLGTIQLYNASAGELVFECAYPPQEQESLVAALGDRQPIDRARAPGGKIGIIGRAAATREPQLVPDTAGDPDYVEYRPSTRSELAVPLLDGETLLGVLNVESDQLAAFDASDVEVLQGLADLAVVALKNAEQAADLSFATSVAMMSAEGAEMAHDVNREVGHIRRAVYILQRRPELGDEVSETLRRIDSSAEAMAWVAVPSSSAEWHQHREFPDAPLVDQVVAAEITRINVARGDQLVQARLQCGDTRVRVPERRLQRLVRHLIQNAANAIPPEKENPYVIVQTAVEGALVRVRVEDSGTGVSTTHLPSLFKSPIHDSDGRLGYGLLLVRFWAEQYGGGIELVSNRPGEGACFSLTLPAAEIDGATTAIGEG